MLHAVRAACVVGCVARVLPLRWVARECACAKKSLVFWRQQQRRRRRWRRRRRLCHRVSACAHQRVGRLRACALSRGYTNRLQILRDAYAGKMLSLKSGKKNGIAMCVFFPCACLRSAVSAFFGLDEPQQQQQQRVVAGHREGTDRAITVYLSMTTFTDDHKTTKCGCFMVFLMVTESVLNSDPALSFNHLSNACAR